MQKLAQEREDLETEVRRQGKGLACAVTNSSSGSMLSSESWLRMAET